MPAIFLSRFPYKTHISVDICIKNSARLTQLDTSDLFIKSKHWQQSAIICSSALIIIALMPLFLYFSGRSHLILLENYNEGWNALFANRIQHGETLYPGPEDLLLNNYPPLSFFLIAGLTKLGGDVMIVGRIASSTAFVFITITIGMIIARRTNVVSGVFAASCFGLLFACFPGQRIGLNDPQLLAHAFMLIGLAVIWIAPNSAWTVVAAAVAMVLGGMIKHNLIAIPLATTLWMIWRGRWSGMTWLMATGMAAGAALLALMAMGGAPMLQSVLSPRHVSLEHALAYSRKLVALIDIPLVVSIIGLASVRNRSDLIFAGLLIAAGFIEMILFAGGDGVVANVAYDLLIAQSLTLGLAVAAVRQPVVIAGVMLFYFFLILPIDQIRESLTGTPELFRRQAKVVADIKYMDIHPGPALCFDPALCWYAGRSPDFDPFNMGQQFSLGVRSAAQLTRRLESNYYALIELSGEEVFVATYALPGEAREILMRNYVIDRTNDGRVFLIPKI